MTSVLCRRLRLLPFAFTRMPVDVAPKAALSVVLVAKRAPHCKVTVTEVDRRVNRPGIVDGLGSQRHRGTQPTDSRPMQVLNRQRHTVLLKAEKLGWEQPAPRVGSSSRTLVELLQALTIVEEA